MTETPKPRKHINPNYDVVATVQEAAKVGDQAFHAWRAGKKVFMDMVPGVELHSVDGEVHVWDGEEWNERIDESYFASSSTVQFNTGDDDLDTLMSFAIDISNELAGMQEHDNYKRALQAVLARLNPPT